MNLLFKGKYYPTFSIVDGLYKWVVKPEFSKENKDLILDKDELLTLAKKEINEWWQVFKEDGNESTEENQSSEIVNYLREDGFPNEIIDEAMK